MALLRKRPAARFKRLLVVDDIVSVPSVLHACGFYDAGTLGSAGWLFNGSCAVCVCVCVVGLVMKNVLSLAGAHCRLEGARWCSRWGQIHRWIPLLCSTTTRAERIQSGCKYVYSLCSFRSGFSLRRTDPFFQVFIFHPGLTWIRCTQMNVLYQQHRVEEHPKFFCLGPVSAETVSNSTAEKAPGIKRFIFLPP